MGIEIHHGKMFYEYGIIDLCYSEDQRLFHFATEVNQPAAKDWVILKTVDLTDGEQFFEFMDNKYRKYRKSGEFPELKIVKMELDLFFELKKVRRKLVKRRRDEQ